MSWTQTGSEPAPRPKRAAWRRARGGGAQARPRALARPTASKARSRRLVARLLGVLAAIGLFVSVALVAPVESASVLAGAGGVLIAVGRVAAMSGTYLLLVTLLLIARIPAVEAGHRPGPPGQAAPNARPVIARADRRCTS